MINDKKFFPLFTQRNIGVLNTVFLNISNYLPHLELRNRSIQIVVIMNFVLISIVSIKRFDCINISTYKLPYL